MTTLVFTGDEWTRCDACRGSGLAGDGCRCCGGSACAVCDGRGEVRKSRTVAGQLLKVAGVRSASDETWSMAVEIYIERHPEPRL